MYPSRSMSFYSEKDSIQARLGLHMSSESWGVQFVRAGWQQSCGGVRRASRRTWSRARFQTTSARTTSPARTSLSSRRLRSLCRYLATSRAPSSAWCGRLLLPHLQGCTIEHAVVLGCLATARTAFCLTTAYRYDATPLRFHGQISAFVARAVWLASSVPSIAWCGCVLHAAPPLRLHNHI